MEPLVYLEFQTKFDKINFIVVGRAEDYNITGKRMCCLSAFKQFRFFLMQVHSTILVHPLILM
jgi:hypothetical protein